jgi:hypothetical protein
VTAGTLVTGAIAVPVAAALFPAVLAVPTPPDRAAADRLSGAAPLPAAGGRRWPADPVAIASLLADARVVLSAAARADIGSGTVDGRVVAVLASLARAHSVEVSVVRTGHSEFVAGTGRISNHFFGRAVDVVAIDGEAVSAASASARRTVHELLDAPAPLRPDELGSPFADVADPAAFSDPGHRDHLHIGFRPPSPGPA